MPERAPHYISLSAAILAGLWASMETPAEHLFEQTMRAFDITGQILAPLDLLAASLATLIAMSVAYLVSTEALARVGFASDEAQ